MRSIIIRCLVLLGSLLFTWYPAWSADVSAGYIQIPTPASHSKDDICISWQVAGAPVKLSTCSYKSGGSGFYVIENSGGKADICWTVSFNNGKNPSNGCHTAMGAGEVSSGSCSGCGSKNGGAKMIVLTKFKPI